MRLRASWSQGPISLQGHGPRTAPGLQALGPGLWVGWSLPGRSKQNYALEGDGVTLASTDSYK